MHNLKWILQHAFKIKWLILGAALLFALEGAASIALVGIQKYIIDDVFLDQRFDLLVPLLAGLAILALVFNVLHLYAARVGHFGFFATQRLLVRKVFQYLHVMPVQQFRKERTGKFVQNLTGDVTQAADVIARTIPQGALQLTQTVLLCVIIGFASPVILISLLAISTIYFALGRYFAPKLKQAGKAKRDKKANLVVHMEESIASSREVIAFFRQKWERTRFHQLFAQYFERALHENKLNNKQMLFSQPLRWSVLLLVFAYGGYLVIQSRMSIGTFVVVYQFSSQLLSAMQGLFGFFMRIAGNVGAVERIREVLEGDTVEKGGQQLTGPLKSLTLRDVSFQYEDGVSPVLKHVDLNIPIGKKVAFVGMSGGGKSTVAQLLIRFYDPTSGDIRVNGIPLSAINREQWLSRLAIVFQEPYLFPDTIRSNLLLGRDFDDATLEEVCRRMQIHDFIMTLPDGYDTEVGERGVKLSGGQRQRIALARALLGEPELLILDEATSALDVETERQVQRNLDDLRKHQTTIVIAHRLSTVIDADLIVVFDGGSIVEQGTHEALLENGEKYKELVLQLERDELANQAM